MFEVMLIICALMRGHVVAVRQRTNGIERRFTLCHFGADGTICQLDECGHVFWHANMLQLWKHLRQAESAGIRYDAAIIDDLREEQEFLAGREAAAVLIDPPSYIKLAA